MKLQHVLIAITLMASIATAADLTWQDLVTRPEIRPTQCSAKKVVQFKNASVTVGQKLEVLKIEPNQVLVRTLDGGLTFNAGPDQVDALAVANADYAKLTPGQRELTYAGLLKRPDLWPWSLTLNATFEVGNRRLNKGDTVYLMSVKDGQLVVCPPQFDMNFNVAPEATDILAFARQYVDDKNGAPGRLFQELDGKLINAATGAATPVKADAPPQYFVIYHAARWCPYTQKFTPGLLKLYQELKAKHPGVELIYVPAEKSAAELQTCATELNFPWPALAFPQKKKLAVLGWALGRSSIPELGVFDRYGNAVIDPAKVDRDEALKQLAALWKNSSVPPSNGVK